MSSRRCVISLATQGDRDRYLEGLVRLEQSLERTGFDGELVFWRPGHFPADSPPHQQVPFAFKPYCFMEARRLGFDSVLWLDSSCLVLRPLDPIFRQIETEGYVIFRNGGYRLGQWSGDLALAAFGLSREQAMNIPEANAAAIGLSMGHELALDFLDRWIEAARGGVVFRGVEEQLATADDYNAVKWNRDGRVSRDPRVRGHRHDQTVAGILAHEMGMKLTAHGLQVSTRVSRPIRRRTVILIDRRNARPAPLKRLQLGVLRGFWGVGRAARSIARLR